MRLSSEGKVFHKMKNLLVKVGFIIFIEQVTMNSGGKNIVMIFLLNLQLLYAHMNILIKILNGYTQLHSVYS